MITIAFTEKNQEVSIQTDLDNLKNFLQFLAPLPDSEWNEFAKGIQVSKFQTGDFIIRYGDSSDFAAFITQGLVKVNYTIGLGKETIRNFCPENSFAIPFADVLENYRASSLEMIALENTEALTFKYSYYEKIRERHWSWQQIGRIMAEQHYLMREKRQYELLTMSAEQRLNSFFESFPTIKSRISQKDLAAFLGVTPVSLSRLRAKLKY